MVRLRETEVVLRLCIVFLLLLTSVLIGLDSQTKEIAYMHKKVTFRYLFALEVELYIDVVVAVYNMVQLGLGWYGVAQKTSNSKWLSYILDQTAVYVVFSGASAAAQHSLLVVTGSRELQWMKCDNQAVPAMSPPRPPPPPCVLGPRETLHSMQPLPL
ncbi:hypothetical protein F2Q68_00040397 [Brassica cretica]|uniref:CASP-like protein n=1 Tax=Brassica cretica TaxID=69181 RepID=A0A8S9MEX4_BRACR|nr:hypothetical protein F2Q68_00040397 [Brassica cretica]